MTHVHRVQKDCGKNGLFSPSTWEISTKRHAMYAPKIQPRSLGTCNAGTSRRRGPAGPGDKNHILAGERGRCLKRPKTESIVQTCFSRNSLASLIFVAKYGLPPRSGWLSSMSWRCFLVTLSLVNRRSLSMGKEIVRLVKLYIIKLVQPGKTYESSRIKEASRRFMRGSKPLYSESVISNPVTLEYPKY